MEATLRSIRSSSFWITARSLPRPSVPGGNINITGDVFLVNSGGQFPTSLAGIVDASSALSTPGTINIEATFTNVVGSFFQLPSTPLQATELLRASCAARFAGGKASSLVLGGRDGLPLQPGGPVTQPALCGGALFWRQQINC